MIEAVATPFVPLALSSGQTNAIPAVYVYITGVLDIYR
jgi:hypothetical protein